MSEFREYHVFRPKGPTTDALNNFQAIIDHVISQKRDRVTLTDLHKTRVNVLIHYLCSVI